MSTHFNANQYDGVFLSHKLQNWEVPKEHKNATWFNHHYVSGRPKAREGFTEIIADDRGHIEEPSKKSETNPWGDFVGTWDLPKKIPGNQAMVSTGRCPDAADKLERHMKDSHVVIGGLQKNVVRKSLPAPSPVPDDAMASNMLTKEDADPDCTCRVGSGAPKPKSTTPAAAPVKSPSQLSGAYPSPGREIQFLPKENPTKLCTPTPNDNGSLDPGPEKWPPPMEGICTPLEMISLEDPSKMNPAEQVSDRPDPVALGDSGRVPGPNPPESGRKSGEQVSGRKEQVPDEPVSGRKDPPVLEERDPDRRKIPVPEWS